MDQDVKDMVSCDTGFPEKIIQRECKVGHKPEWIKPDNPQRIAYILDRRIPGKVPEVIKHKRIGEGKAIAYPYSHDQDHRIAEQAEITVANVKKCRNLFTLNNVENNLLT
jgi:hypothetical protein